MLVFRFVFPQVGFFGWYRRGTYCGYVWAPFTWVSPLRLEGRLPGFFCKLHHYATGSVKEVARCQATSPLRPHGVEQACSAAVGVTSPQPYYLGNPYVHV